MACSLRGGSQGLMLLHPSAPVCFFILGLKDNFVVQPTGGYSQLGAVVGRAARLSGIRSKVWGLCLFGHTPWRRGLSEAIDLDPAGGRDIGRRYACGGLAEGP